MAQPYFDTLTRTIMTLELSASEDISLECKHFFSGAALYADGKICASLTPAGFGLKLPVEVRNRLIDDGDGDELRYFEKAPVKRKYVALSPSVLDDPERLKPLLELSISYVTKSDISA